MGYDGTRRAQRFYRDPRQGRLMGVCAGVAEYFGCSATLIRILALIALFQFGAVTLVAYLMLGFMLPIKPTRPTMGMPMRNARATWGAHRPEPSATCVIAVARWI